MYNKSGDKMKRMLILLIVTILVVGISISIFFFDNKENINEESKKEEKTVINNELPNSYDVEVFTKTNIKDLTGDENLKEIDTNKLGKQTIKYEYNGEIKEIVVNVIDTTSPYIGVGDHYSHIINTTFTFDKDVICVDNYDKNIKCILSGDYKLDELGEYSMKIEATDSSNNKTEKEFILRVIEKPKSDNNDKIKIEDIKLNDGVSLMIDVSKWQKDIDWKKVKKAGIDYAMLRLGTQKGIDDDSVLDSYFDKNIREAQKNGIKVGVYYYSYANDIEDIKTQANWVVEQLKNYKIDLFVSLDWECWKYFNDFHFNLYEFNEMGRTFLKIISDNGYKAINYGSKNYLEHIWNIDEYGTWLAHYNDKTTYSKDYIIWQFTDKGVVPGINSVVDLNYFYYNYNKEV